MHRKHAWTRLVIKSPQNSKKRNAHHLVSGASLFLTVFSPILPLPSYSLLGFAAGHLK